MTTPKDTDRPLGKLPLDRRRFLHLGAAGVASLILPWSLAEQTLAAETVTTSGRLSIGFSQEPTVFNPLMPHIEVDDGIHWNLFDPLFFADPQGNLVPALAAEVPTVENGGISADGLSWHIKLRDDVRWHDGQPFTAEDVAFTFRLTVDPDFRSARHAGFDLIDEIEVISPTELRWTMSESYAPFLSILATTFIVPSHLLASQPNEAPFNNAPVGTGAFKWKDRVAGDHILLEANEAYFGTGPGLEEVVFRYIPDITVLYTQFRTGDIDVIGMQGIMPDHYEEAKGLNDKAVVLVPSASVESIAFNMERPQFQDPAVRQALYLALDKATILDALYYGLPEETESYMPHQSPYYNHELPPHQFDLEAAKQLLDDAGWLPGSDGVREKAGVRLSFTNSTTAGNQVREQMQQFVQQTWLALGVDMQISNRPPAVMWGDYWMQSQFDSVVVGLNFLTGSDPDVSNYFRSDAIPAQNGGGQNTFQYQNSEIDRLLGEGASEPDPAKRQPIYHQIQAKIRADLPLLPLFQYAYIRGYKDGLQGFEGNINTRISTWNVNQWRWS
ncbi:peptide ABC transporter substrate-binding protein [Salinicola aestuarinus]|uniref:peptide ABC transporter substrate-binding protein n=1 Tax=Salinicola aestuarinus TaxID=1949082 RepID=UPI000DA16039|nr:peptide ABC transporter substrate-binding protein [Salinicola aestuarinus]